MAAGAKPPIIGTAVAGWRDAFGAIAAMPATCGITFVILIALGALRISLQPDATAQPFDVGPQVISILSVTIDAFLLAPLAIAVHRYVLLGEVTTGYALSFSSSRYLRFAGFATLINALLLAPSLVLTVLPPGKENLAASVIGLVAMVVLFILMTIVTLRRAILFPAIAIDPPNATWTNARNDTQGNTWRVLFIFLCTAIPLIVFTPPIYLLLPKPASMTTGGQILFSAMLAIVQVPTVCAFAATASHIFRALADNLARPASTSAAAA